jgi:hypothetical protein
MFRRRIHHEVLALRRHEEIACSVDQSPGAEFRAFA